MGLVALRCSWGGGVRSAEGGCHSTGRRPPHPHRFDTHAPHQPRRARRRVRLVAAGGAAPVGLPPPFHLMPRHVPRYQWADSVGGEGGGRWRRESRAGTGGTPPTTFSGTAHQTLSRAHEALACRVPPCTAEGAGGVAASPVAIVGAGVGCVVPSPSGAAASVPLQRSPPPHWTPEGQPTGKDRPQRPAAPAGKMAGANKTEMGWFLVSSCSGRRPAGPRPLVGVSGRAGRTQQPERGGRNNGCAFVGEEDGRGPRQPSPPPTRGTRRGCRRGADRLASRWAGGMGSVATASVLSRQRLARRRVGWGGGGWDAWFN